MEKETYVKKGFPDITLREMEKEMSLSEKILESYQQGDYDFIDVRDVKEFIKRQERLVNDVLNKRISEKEFVRKWDKLAGDKLT